MTDTWPIPDSQEILAIARMHDPDTTKLILREFAAKVRAHTRPYPELAAERDRKLRSLCANSSD